DDCYLSRFGYDRKQVLADNRVTFCSVSDLSRKHVEGNLGNILRILMCTRWNMRRILTACRWILR
ncbi:MAG: hypothetical protein NC086_08185, partial [Alistipes sp.]|nr:hypothetical protein [Alistipes sp.]